MDKEKALKEIQSNIKAGNADLASQQILMMADHFSDDPFTLLTCVSLLKVIEDGDSAHTLAAAISGKVRDGDRVEVAKGLRGVGFPVEAEKVLSPADGGEAVRERMRTLFDLARYAEVSAAYGQLAEPTLEDTAVMIASVSHCKEHGRAVKLAEELLAEAPDVLSVQRCYCSALYAAGRPKEAERFVKDNLKKNKSSPDADTLASFCLWIEGKTASAGAYASKAVKADPDNTAAMEILAYCLIEKKKFKEAKIIAGAINEKEPGNPAAFKILEMCRVFG
ncbi:MAG: tetratricopeptide repeat protein [Candidatus Methanoplasma sp.]|jgi:tetratricopeptide (TPR) repeat protein|nr:tetratricopeptide repeat protein [Candidatus Methanoplasma sp.]